MSATASDPGAPLPEGTLTVLFTDLVDSTQLNQQYGDEVANSVRREVEQLALASVDRNRGHVVKGLGDGLMVAFQSARRAVACAQEIQRALAGRRTAPDGPHPTMRIGLHTGEVISEDGDLHGETVIIAKRIEGVAPAGGILASETVHGVLGTARSELVDRGEFELKGIDVPWRLYEVPIPVERGEPIVSGIEPSPFVGRVRELAVLSDAVARAREGHGSVLLISGEAGAGKSRIVHEAAMAATKLEMAVLAGHCVDMEAPVPYHPVVEQLEQTARALSPEDFRLALGENAPEVARLMPELHRVYDDIGSSPAMPADQERRYLLHGLGRFVERGARRRPMMLLYEDLHWADEASLLLIETLVRMAADLPLLIVGTYRAGEVMPSDPFARTLEELTRHRLATELRLEPLSESDVAALLAGRAGSRPPAELVRLVYDETEGNPFFVEEVFLHLVERGALFDGEGKWRSGVAIADTEVPRSVRLVIERRLEAAGQEVRQVLTAAAVIGRRGSFELLLETADKDEDAVMDALETAERAQLVVGTVEGGNVVYTFVHEQIRQTLLAGLSALRRQRLHVRVADALEARAGAGLQDRAADIAHHLQLAGAATTDERRMTFLALAARHALSAVAPEDALRHLEPALELVDPADDARRPELLVLRSQALRAMGRIDEALHDLGVALALEPPGPAHDSVLRRRAGLHLDRFDGASAAADLEVALVSARDRGDRQAELDTLLALARAHYVRSLDDPGLAPEARDTYEQAYGLASELGNRRAMAGALLPTVWFMDYWAGYEPTARANLAEAKRLAEELGDEDLSIDADTAALRLLRGQEAEGSAERVRELLEARHDPVRLKEHYFFLMWVYYERGRLTKSVETCDLGIELATQLGSAPVQYGTIKALALSELGRFDLVDAALAQEVADDFHPFGRACRDYGRALFLGMVEAWEPAAAAARVAMEEACDLSRVWMQQGMINLAASLGARAGMVGGPDTTVVRSTGDAAGLRPSARMRAEEALAAGRPDEAVELMASCVDRIQAEGGIRELAWMFECLSRAEVTAGRADSSLSVAERGLVVTASTGQLPVSWRLHGCRAEALGHLGRGAEAEAARGAARDEFATLAARIADQELRRCFESQPLVARWLGGSGS